MSWPILGRNFFLSFSQRERTEQVAWLLWAAIVIGICVRSFLSPTIHSVYPIFSIAGQNWVAGNDLYKMPHWPLIDQYRYSPLVTVWFVPFSQYSDAIGGVLWRLASLAVFVWGFAWWCRSVLPECNPHASRENIVTRSVTTTFRSAWLWLLLLPLTIQSLNNGQANVMVIGLLLVGVAGAADGRWHMSAITVALACLFKIYPIAVGLLLIVLYPRKFTPRFLLAIAAGLLLPFLFQHPDYVRDMYAGWAGMFTLGDRSEIRLDLAYRDLRMLFRLYAPIDALPYLAIQMGSAAAIAALCLAGRLWGKSERRMLTILTLLSTAWMMLCGPTTESSTYTLLAPAFAWIVFDVWTGSRSIWTRAAILVMVFLFLGKPVLTVFPGLVEHSYGWRPWGTLILMGLVLITQVPRLFQVARNDMLLKPRAGVFEPRG